MPARPSRSDLQYWMPLAIWVFAILGVSSIPGATLARVGISIRDSFAHGIEYGVLGFLACRGEVMVRRRRGAVAWGIAWLGAVVLGAVDETYQRFIPGRFSAVEDWAADAVGAALGAAVALALYIPARRSVLRHEHRAAAGREEEA